MSITLKIASGPMTGKTFKFDEPDIFLFGRQDDCHCCLPDDGQISRHHFILEANPPRCRIKDLASLNGTYINGIKHGGRSAKEPWDIREAEKNAEAVDLKDGDQIRVGQTNIYVAVQKEKEAKLPAQCIKCGKDIPCCDKEIYSFVGGTFLCGTCRKQMDQAEGGKKAPLQKPPKVMDSNEAMLDDLFGVIFGKAGQEGPVLPDISGYECVREIGRGGFGRVFLVKRKSDGKKLALKILLAGKKEVRQKDIELFQREMSNVMSFRHKYIVEYAGQGHENGFFYFLMEYCAGGSVNDLMSQRGGKLSQKEAASYMLQILEGLEFIHNKGFVHRDLKPDNILFDENRANAKIADFGVAKNFQKAGLSGFTITGTSIGTRPFMPKEQLTNFKFVGPGTDVFSIGATFYNMLTGQFVYNCKGRDPTNAILKGDIVPIGGRQGDFSKSVAEVIDKSISVLPEARYTDAGEMRKALEKALRQ